MRKIKIIGLILCLAVSFTSFAMMVASAGDGVNTERVASLELTYSYGDNCVEGEEIKLYRVADMTGNTRFTRSGAFKSLPISLNTVKSQSEWKAIASTAASYVVSERISPTAVETSDENGVAKFTGLATGLYLVSGLRIEFENGYAVFEDFMITLPGVDMDKEWLYDVKAVPKHTFEEKIEDDVDYKVIKLWKDDGKESQRPREVEISLFCDGELRESVKLSDENNWTYEWSSAPLHTWTVREENVAKDYTVTVSNKEYTIYVTNSLEGPPPQTGEEANTYLIVALMSLGGAGLLMFGLRKRRGSEE